jgi:transcription antitermination factor NusG
VLEQRAGASDNLNREKSLFGAPPTWFAVHVKSRHEFVVVHELGEKNIEAFLPSAKKISQWKDRRKLVEHPLFPGYVFVRVPSHPTAFLAVLKTRGVVAFIALEPGLPTPIAPEEIRSLKLVIESGGAFDVYPHLREGTRVRVKNGPLRNAEGVLVKREQEHVFVVNIELLGRSVAMKISAHEIEPA